MNVLIVDDSRIMRNIVKNTLEENLGDKLVCLEARDGVEAKNLLQTTSVGLLLLDWNMPNLNGLDLVNYLRKKEQFKSLPIIMITSEAAKYNVIEAVKAGVNDYIVKPVSEKALLQKIERFNLY